MPARLDPVFFASVQLLLELYRSPGALRQAPAADAHLAPNCSVSVTKESSHARTTVDDRVAG